MRKRLIVSAAASALALLLAVPASAAQAGPGAAGIGDAYYPNAGNGGYDVSHYDLRLKYQPATDELEGTATILATATQDLTRFNLDFVLGVKEVLVNGRTAGFASTGEQELEITPARTLTRGSTVTVVVRYAGKPGEVKRGGYSAWLRTPDGGVAANEPEGSAWWFPSNDHPTDKATYDVSVLVPDGTQAISNGRLVGQSSKAGWTRYSWRETEPQATYLATLAIGRFDVRTDTTPSGLPVITAYSKDLGDNDGAARASVERTGELVDWLSEYFGPYPFKSAGGYVPNVPTGYALETQTRVFYSPAQFARGSNTSVVVHELAHQWYGDSVSVQRWSDIWLNEGFARYSQWLWSEHENEGTAQELADYVYSSYPAGDAFWTVEPGDPGPDHQFAGAVYDRGAVAIQALRNAVGDEKFFRILKGWPAERRFGNATIQQFQAYAEQVSGKPLADLFQTWLFTPAKPAVSSAGVPAAVAAAAGAPGGAALAPGAGEQPREPKSWKKIQETNSVHEHRH
ncbi:M1 family metallopeptidase [Kitasatospora sp. A2-31]|uniref:M1 family metallopeptidase n=1 Tax=Kitasatospora sp. A2-31 TaxID=2916414 RepID=UPI001EEA1A77|nr:M1 family metallopeptidase [Kitasatospora sp. A2-31]MCG6495420.1 M1 family metallopeptidase [Kitasatospora sp. A2-31]